MKIEEDEMSDDLKMMAFTYDDNNEQFFMQGKVTKSLILRPKSGAQYSNLLRDRNIRANFRHETKAATNEASVFVIHEVWENQAIFEEHNTKQYIKDFFEVAPTLLREKPEVIFTKRLK